MRKPTGHSPSKKKTPSPSAKIQQATRQARHPSPKAKEPSSVDAFPTLLVAFDSIEVKRGGWPGDPARAADLSLILQLEMPSAAPPGAALASARLPFRAAAGQTSPRRSCLPTRPAGRSSAGP